jgi:hypothetical protein
LEEEEDRLIKAGFYDKEMEPMDDEAKDIKKLAKKFEILTLNYFISLRSNNY